MGFDFNRWASGVDKRFGDLREWTADADTRIDDLRRRIDSLGNRAAAGKTGGLGDLGPTESRALVRTIEDMASRHASIVNELENLRAQDEDIGGRTVRAVRALEDSDTEVRNEVQVVLERLAELSLHVGVYDEAVQGIAIRPQRAVPAVVKDRQTGSANLNPVKVHVKPFWLASSSRTVVVPASNKARVTFTVQPEENLEGDMEIYALELCSATSTSVRVKLSHTGLGGLFLMNNPVHLLSVFGNMNAGAQPFELFETIFLEPGQELGVEFFDFSGADNTLEVIVHGRRFLGYGTSGMDRRGLINTFSRAVWPYWITTDETLLLNAGAGVVTNCTFTVNRQFHFEAAKTMAFGTTNGVPGPVPFHIQLNEGQSGRLIADNVPGKSFAGDGNFPFPVFEPYLGQRGTSLRGAVSNDNGLANQATDIVFHGRGLPISMPGQRTLEPAVDGRNVLMPPSQKDLTIQRMVSQ